MINDFNVFHIGSIHLQHFTNISCFDYFLYYRLSDFYFWCIYVTNCAMQMENCTLNFIFLTMTVTVQMRLEFRYAQTILISNCSQNLCRLKFCLKWKVSIVIVCTHEKVLLWLGRLQWHLIVAALMKFSLRKFDPCYIMWIEIYVIPWVWTWRPKMITCCTLGSSLSNSLLDLFIVWECHWKKHVPLSIDSKACCM